MLVARSSVIWAGHRSGKGGNSSAHLQVPTSHDEYSARATIDNGFSTVGALQTGVNVIASLQLTIGAERETQGRTAETFRHRQ